MGRYIHATKGSIIALAVFGVLAYIVPGGRESGVVELLLTASTFLFAILAGFYLSRLSNRYDRVRELIAQEDAQWIAAHELAHSLGDEYHNRFVALVDKFYIASFDYSIGDATRVTKKYREGVFEALRETTPENFKSQNAYDNTQDLLAQMAEKGNQMAVISRERLSRGQWGVVIALAGIIIFSLFFLKGSAFLSEGLIALLSSVLVLLLLLMRDLQNFFLGGKTMVEESSQEVFESIGRLRYYPLSYLRRHRVKFPHGVKKYRVGHHDVYDDPESPLKIKEVKVGDDVI